MITDKDLLKSISIIPTWISDNEKLELFKLAHEVPEDGKIVEIGCLYGASSAALGLSVKANVKMTIIDNFSWDPSKLEGWRWKFTNENKVKPSKKVVTKYLETVGVENFHIIASDSTKIVPEGLQVYKVGDIDLLWVDGGHEADIISYDLKTFGPYANTIAVHDFHDSYWLDVNEQVYKFLENHPEFYLDHEVEQIAVLRRNINQNI